MPVHGFVYKLRCMITALEYVGSTERPLAVRLTGHRYQARTNPLRVHTYFNTVGWDNAVLELVEECTVADTEALRRREQYWIRTLAAGLNDRRAYLSNAVRLEEDNAVRRTQVPCVHCGASVSRRNMARHRHLVHGLETIVSAETNTAA